MRLAARGPGRFRSAPTRNYVRVHSITLACALSCNVVVGGSAFRKLSADPATGYFGAPLASIRVGRHLLEIARGVSWGQSALRRSCRMSQQLATWRMDSVCVPTHTAVRFGRRHGCGSVQEPVVIRAEAEPSTSWTLRCGIRDCAVGLGDAKHTSVYYILVVCLETSCV